MVKNTVIYLNNALKEGRSIVAEGAQSTMLDIDFGKYCFYLNICFDNLFKSIDRLFSRKVHIRMLQAAIVALVEY